jgi:Tol biopolymer transport system component
MTATAAGLASAEAHRSDGATGPSAHPSALLGTFACTDRLDRLTLVRGDGRKRRTLRVKGEDPTFSPDGRRIVFRAVQRGYARNIAPKLLVTDGSGRNVRTLVSLPRSSKYGQPPRFEPLSWSGDSTRLAYVREVIQPGRDAQSRPGLFTVNASGGGEYEVPLHREGESPSAEPGLAPGGVAALSPDGQTVAIAAIWYDQAANSSKNGIWLADPSSGAARLLLETSSKPPLTGIPALTWSPDGSRLAVYGGSGFFVLNVRTLKATRSDRLIGDSWARWAPDGRRIAVDGVANSGRQTKYDSRVADADMSRVTDPSRRTPKGYEETNQLWSPDGRRIAFNRTFMGETPRFKRNEQYAKYYRKTQSLSGVYVVSANGGKPKKLIGSSPARPGSADPIFHPNELKCTDWRRR